MSSKLLINEPPLMLLPSLAKTIGLNEAIILQQVHYWLDPRINKNFYNYRHWVYNSYAQWQEQFPFWSERTLRRSIKSLESTELLIYDFFNKNSFDKTKWYTINYDKLNSLESIIPPCGHYGRIDTDKMAIPIRTSSPNEQAIMATSIIDTKTTTKINHTLSKKRESSNKFDLAVILWNEKILCNETQVSLTFQRKNKLQKIFTTLFQNNIEEWESYLKNIQKSKFLMGEVTNFKVNFDWAIVQENALKVLEGVYSDLKNKKQQPKNTNKDFSEKHIEKISDSIWKKLNHEMLKEFGADVFRSWFVKLELDNISNYEIHLKAENEFTKNYIMMHYFNRLMVLLKKIEELEKYEKIIISFVEKTPYNSK